MGKIKDALGDRIVSIHQTSKLTRYIAKCPTADCTNTTTVEKMKHVDSKCKKCASIDQIGLVKSDIRISHLDSLVRVERNAHNKPVYVYRCSICSADTTPKLASLRSNSVKCKQCTNRDRPYEYLFKQLLRRCKEKSISTDINYEAFFKLIEANSECYYCSKDLNRAAHRSDYVEGKTSIQIDRKDSYKGYTLDNCVSCCWECNDMKSDWFTSEQFKLVRMIYDNKLEELQKLL